MRERLLFFPVFLFIAMHCCSSHAQNFPSLQFSHITTKEGLSSNYATSISEDKQGFIWIGTGNGLNRYDGYRFKHYYHSNSDTNSLVSNDIQTLYSDSKGRLWICTSDGVSCFIPGSNQFINYSTRSAAPHKLNNNSSVKIYEDRNKTIWLCNQLNVIYRINDHLEAVPLTVNIPAFSFFQETRFGYDNIYRDNIDNEWAFTSNHLYLLNPQTKQPAASFDLSVSIHTNIIKMLQLADDYYLISTWNNGIFYFSPSTGKLQPIDGLPRRIFSDMAEWKYQQTNWLFYLEANLGLYLVNRKTQEMMRYTFVPGDPTSMQGNSYFQHFIDSKNNVWIGSNGGVNLLTAVQQVFDVIAITDPGSSNYSIYKNGPVFSYFETDSSVWLGKRFVSTFEYDKNLHLKKYYASLAPLSAVKNSSNGYAYYFFGRGKDIFITTDSGFVMLNTASRTTTLYTIPGLPARINLRTIIPLTENELLIRSFDDGLFVFNITEKKFTRRYRNEDICSNCPSVKINYLFKSSKGAVLLCTRGQKNNLYQYNHSTDSFAPVTITNSNNYALLSADIFGIEEDRKHKLWIASTAGLFVYDPASSTIIKQVAENKEMGTLFRICFDDDGNLWGSSASGIWCYTKATGQWIGFNSTDGLPGSQFEGIIAKRPNGDIIAGIEGAIAVFHPAQLFSKSNEPPAVITEAAIGDRLLPFALTTNTVKKLSLQPGENYFAVDFALLNYINTAGSRYYYKLEPLMDDFQLNDNGHINFNGLAPGIYTLHVKGGNKAAIIFSNEDVLTIEVLPYWYQAGLFKSLCILMVAAAIAFFVKWRINAVKKQAGLKQQIAETQMQALRAQMNPHFIFNSLNSIENFMMQNEKRLASDYLNKFSRLIRSILDSSRNELVPLAKDMEALQLYVDLQQLRLSHKFSYNTNIDPVLLQGDFKVPSLLIQPFVENAIEHGLSHSDKNDLSLTVKAVLQNDCIIYTIEDNGIGRRQSAAYNQQNKPYHKSVGLSITTDRLKLLNAATYNDNNVHITDLYTVQHEPAGTRVTLHIKPQ
ncbi:MAG: histidine kinase [Chitinophagaceae bacterium]|nr:histidine kinase [Chitinophagaceae bacterium]